MGRNCELWDEYLPNTSQARSYHSERPISGAALVQVHWAQELATAPALVKPIVEKENSISHCQLAREVPAIPAWSDLVRFSSVWPRDEPNGRFRDMIGPKGYRSAEAEAEEHQYRVGIYLWWFEIHDLEGTIKYLSLGGGVVPCPKMKGSIIGRSHSGYVIVGSESQKEGP